MLILPCIAIVCPIPINKNQYMIYKMSVTFLISVLYVA